MNAHSASKDRLRPARIGPVTWVVIFLVMIGLLVWANDKAHQPLNGISVDELRADLMTHCPLGTPRAQVLSWFTAKNIPLGHIVDPQNHPAQDIDATLDNSSFLVTADIHISCYFDAQGRLEHVRVHRHTDW